MAPQDHELHLQALPLPPDQAHLPSGMPAVGNVGLARGRLSQREPVQCAHHRGGRHQPSDPQLREKTPEGIQKEDNVLTPSPSSSPSSPHPDADVSVSGPTGAPLHLDYFNLFNYLPTSCCKMRCTVWQPTSGNGGRDKWSTSPLSLESSAAASTRAARHSNDILLIWDGHRDWATILAPLPGFQT